MDRAHNLGQPVTGFAIAPVEPADAGDWLALREALYRSPRDDLAAEIAAALQAPKPGLVLIARSASGVAVGLLELSVRHDYVNGCATSPVAFLEGIYVASDCRRQGLAASMVTAAAVWAKSEGLTEMASDALLANTISHAMHKALGFSETDRVIFFNMPLRKGGP